MWGVPGFFHPNLLPSWLAPAGSPQALSYSRHRAVARDARQAGRLGASQSWADALLGRRGRMSESGNFVYFDNRDPHWKRPHRRPPCHGLGRAAAGLPAGRDRGAALLGRRPRLEHAAQPMCSIIMPGDLLDLPGRSLPCRGPMPQGMTGAWSRQKDIQYSSRTRQVTDQYLRERREHKAIRDPAATPARGSRANARGAANSPAWSTRGRSISCTSSIAPAPGKAARAISSSRAAPWWIIGRRGRCGRGGRIAARATSSSRSNINEGRSATFDSRSADRSRRKQA